MKTKCEENEIMYMGASQRFEMLRSTLLSSMKKPEPMMIVKPVIPISNSFGLLKYV